MESNAVRVLFNVCIWAGCVNAKRLMDEQQSIKNRKKERK